MATTNLPRPIITITKPEARRFLLSHHSLWPPHQFQGKAGVMKFIHQVNSIQFDPINIVGRNPDLVLQSRISDYQPTYLDQLLYEERKLIDGWDKMASIYASTDWPFFTYWRNHLRNNPDTRKPPEIILNQTIDHIQKRGPLSSLDFKEQEKIDWHWGPTKAVRAAMEYLFSRGYLGVHHRINNRRYFDLVENLLPADLLNAPNPFNSIETYQDWHVLRRVGSLGLAQINTGDCWGGIIGVNAKLRHATMLRLFAKNEVLPVNIEGQEDNILFIRAIDLPTLERAQKDRNPNPSAAIIAPLDNLVWNRNLIENIFDFRYRWEVYKPREQREFGYYVLPVLYNDRFVARIEPTFNKKNCILTLQNWWWEPGITPDENMQAALLKCMHIFCDYLNVESLLLANPIQKGKNLKWLKNLKI